MTLLAASAAPVAKSGRRVQTPLRWHQPGFGPLAAGGSRLDDFSRLQGSDFEAVDVSSLQVSADSGQVVGFDLTVTPRSQAIEPGQSTVFTITVSYIGNFSQPVTLATVVSPSLSLHIHPDGVIASSDSLLTLTDTRYCPASGIRFG